EPVQSLAEFAALVERDQDREGLATQKAPAPLQDVDRGAVHLFDRARVLGDDVGFGRLLEEVDVLLALAGKLVDLRFQVEPHGLQIFQFTRHRRPLLSSIRLRYCISPFSSPRAASRPPSAASVHAPTSSAAACSPARAGSWRAPVCCRASRPPWQASSYRSCRP